MSIDVAPSWAAPLPGKFRRQESRAYLNAERTKETRRLWKKADGSSARAASSPDQLRALRNASRHEYENSAYFAGLVQTLANDLIGTGPRLQSLIPDNDAINTAIEMRWAEWCERVGFAESLNTAVQAEVRDGATLCLLAVDPTISGEPNLDPLWLEIDHLSTPVNKIPVDRRNWVDGIELDDRGRPRVYHVLRQHPGDMLSSWNADYIRWPANRVIHLFRRDRPEQCHGVPQLTASLHIFGQLREWTKATLTAAELAADIAILLTGGPLDDGTGETDDGECPAPYSTTAIERGTMMTLGDGQDAKAFKSEHPNQEYQTFKHELVKEGGRPVNAPFCVSGGDSSPYNYSSAKLDISLYRRAGGVARNRIRRTAIDRVFDEWYSLALMYRDYLPAGSPPKLPRAWYWPGFASIEPLKEANADHQQLADGTTTLQELLAENGQDWMAFLRQRQREIQTMRDMGIPLPEWAEPKGGAQMAQEEPPPPPANGRLRPLLNGRAH